MILTNTTGMSHLKVTRWQFKLITYGYEPPVNDANEPNKQISQKCSVTNVNIFYRKSGT